MARLTSAFVRFQENPSSFRYAAAAIISTIVILVFAGALVIQLLSPDEYPDYGEALWFTLQTVTTVGYGDSTPTSGTVIVDSPSNMPSRFSARIVISAGAVPTFMAETPV